MPWVVALGRNVRPLLSITTSLSSSIDHGVVGSVEATPSTSKKPRAIKLLVDEKTHPEKPNKAHKEPKPVWTGQVIERKERERNKYGHCPGKEQEAVEFITAIATRMAGCLSPVKARE